MRLQFCAWPRSAPRAMRARRSLRTVFSYPSPCRAVFGKVRRPARYRVSMSGWFMVRLSGRARRAEIEAKCRPTGRGINLADCFRSRVLWTIRERQHMFIQRAAAHVWCRGSPVRCHFPRAGSGELAPDSIRESRSRCASRCNRPAVAMSGTGAGRRTGTDGHGLLMSSSRRRTTPRGTSAGNSAPRRRTGNVRFRCAPRWRSAGH